MIFLKILRIYYANFLLAHLPPLFYGFQNETSRSLTNFDKNMLPSHYLVPKDVQFGGLGYYFPRRILGFDLQA